MDCQLNYMYIEIYNLSYADTGSFSCSVTDCHKPRFGAAVVWLTVLPPGENPTKQTPVDDCLVPADIDDHPDEQCTHQENEPSVVAISAISGGVFLCLALLWILVKMWRRNQKQKGEQEQRTVSE